MNLKTKVLIVLVARNPHSWVFNLCIDVYKRQVFTHHGPDYDRDKWGFAAKTILKMGERMGCMLDVYKRQMQYGVERILTTYCI